MMEEEKKQLLGDVFDILLNLGETNVLINNLLEHHFLSKDDDSRVKELPKKDKLMFIMDRLKLTDKWINRTKSIFETKMRRPELKHIFSAVVDSNNEVLWILSKWRELSENKNIVEDMAFLMKKCELPPKKLLETFTTMVYENKDPEFMQRIMDVLKQKIMSKTDSSDQKSIDPGRTTSKEKESMHAKEFEKHLVPLVPIISHQVTCDEMDAIIKYLRHKKHIKKKVKGARAERFVNLVTLLKISAQDSWKWDLLDALKVYIDPRVYFVVEKCLFPMSEIFQWLISNWNTFVVNESIFQEAADRVFEALSLGSPPISILHELVMNETNGTKFKQIFESLQGKYGGAKQTDLCDSNLYKTEKYNGEKEVTRDMLTVKQTTDEELPLTETEMEADPEVVQIKIGETEYNQDQLNVKPDKKITSPIKEECIQQEASNPQVAPEKASKNKMKERKLTGKPVNLPDFNYNHYFDSDNLPKSGKNLLEFRAILSEPLDDNVTLCVYIKKDDIPYRMHYDMKTQVYCLLYSDADNTTLYNYVVHSENGDDCWEILPSRREDYNHVILNRSHTVCEDTKHMITFDVIFFGKMEFNKFTKEYSHHFVKHLPLFSMLYANDNGYLPLHVLFKIYNECFSTFKRGTEIVSDIGNDIVLSQLEADDFNKFLVNQIHTDPLKRVLSAFAFITAMELNYSVPNNSEFISNLCTCLSLHDLNEEEQNVIRVQLATCYEIMEKVDRNVKRIYKDVLNRIFQLFEEPECLLFLPIYSHVLDTMENIESKEIKLAITTPEIYKFHKQEYQGSIKAMAEKVVQISSTFPKLRELYQRTLMPKTISELFDNSSYYYQLFDVDTMFKNLLSSWSHNYQDLEESQQIISTLSNFVFDHIRKNVADLETKELADIENNFIKHSENLLDFSSNLLIKMKSSKHPSICFAHGFKLIAESIQYAALLEEKFQTKQLGEKIRSINTSLLLAVPELFSDANSKTISLENIELWNTLTSVTWEKGFKEVWITQCCEEMRRILQKTENLLDFYANQLDELSLENIVEKCFTEVVDQQTEQNLQDESTRGIISTALNYFKPKAVKMVAKIFMNQWKKHGADTMDSDDIIMKFLLNSLTVSLLVRPIAKKGAEKSLEEKCKSAVNKCKQAVNQMITNLQEGTILLSTLEKFVIHKNDFVTACDALTEDMKGDVDQHQPTEIGIKLLIEHRLKELTNFQQTRENLQFFLDCVKSTFKEEIFKETEMLQRVLQTDYSTAKLCSVMACEPIMTIAPQSLAPITVFELQPNILQDIRDLKESKALLSSFIQDKLNESWKSFQSAKNDGYRKIDVLTFMKQIWSPVQEHLLGALQNIDNGSLLIVDVNKLLQDFTKPANIEKQFTKLYALYETCRRKNKDLPSLNQRTGIEKLTNYFALMQISRQANRIDSLRTKLNLNQLETLKDILELTSIYKSKTLDEITKDIMAMAHTLDNISEDINLVINACDEHFDLIMWLKENMKNIGEVQVMGDLAMISAGDSSFEIDKVSIFLSAVMGFSPVVFDLRPDATWEQFLSALTEVQCNIKKKPKLLKEWNETAGMLQWLKDIKNLHGSVEKSSLERARLINQKGTYIIGSESTKFPKFEDSLKLKIPQQEFNKENGKKLSHMTFSELRDLQSRLMLIAGEAEKGKQDVNRFTAVLSVIEKLTKAYIKIRNSGCLLFSNWRADIRCYEGEGQVTMLVYFGKETPAITSCEKVIPEVCNLTTVLEKLQQEWLEYLHKKRCTHYHLNHYNIHQITYLCKNLANSEDIEDFPDQVYCLLESVLPNASSEDLMKALDEATMKKDDVDMDNDDVDQDENQETLIGRKMKLVRQLVREGLPQDVSKAAVKKLNTFDFDDCYLWGLENSGKDFIKDLKEEFDQEVEFSESSYKIGVVKDVIKDKLNKTLNEVIEHILESPKDSYNIPTFVNTICKRYLNETSVTSLNDCISLEHLGLFLHHLEISNPTSGPYREWTEQFVPGKPNLIVCPLIEVWRTILSIYAISPDQPLPSASEVLVCSETTTADHVELLLRRAIGRKNENCQKIYCLACADLLTFTASKEVEQVFQQLLQRENHNDEYRLVVIASSAQHYISTCFNEHQLTKADFPTEAELNKHIEKHLQVSDEFEKSAAFADKDRSAVRLVNSEQAGNGKSLYINRRREELFEDLVKKSCFHFTVLRFLEKTIDIHDVTSSLLKEDVCNADPHFVHIDITPSVDSSVQKFLFDLIFLGSIENSQGVMWRRHPNHFYAIEYTQPTVTGVSFLMQVLHLVPSVTCLPPLEVRQVLLHGSQKPNSVLMDKENFASPVFQRPYQYLVRYKNAKNLDGFKYSTTEGTLVDCLSTLIEFCRIERPSWAEISHFASFLNVQLEDSEKSIFCDLKLMGIRSGLSGFKKFVVRFMIRMSQDFATPSLAGFDERENIEGNDIFKLHQLRRRWESGLHSYLFFNDDGAIRSTMSFVQFNISAQGNLCNPVTKEVLEKNIMSPNLYEGLTGQRVCLNQNFDDLSRKSKLETLCGVFGIFKVFDPDPSYELTTDNVLKMLAIHMRFRCNIPVVIMGETGCGKTRMIEFMSKLKAGQGSEIQNMLTIKVHGGITVAVIQDKVRQAVQLAQQNQGVETILFLDEANTTEAIYAIKEVVCDNTVHGQPFAQTGLKIVAACNPYRKHSDEDIRSMENCGLGFNVKASNIKDKFADIPMRHLVYRVIPLPPSMQPLVWDFGQLNTQTEQIYINQMVVKMVDNIGDAFVFDKTKIITKVLSASQNYMRNTTDVCRFVSLRDVERAIMSFTWFYENMETLNPMVEREKQETPWQSAPIGTVLRAFIQALGMCYHTTLQNRQAYREMVVKELQPHIRLDQRDILDEIVACQSVFMNAIEVEDDIARNEALRENVFMMIICAEMRIPLFLVGKPGSSKSLAKTIVTKAMQGKNSKGPLFQQLKQIHVSSFQCSPMSDAVGIETIFTQCAQIQSKQDLDKFVAVVVLDEIGLAEDSRKMPLKVLHPLLEVGSTTHTSFDAPKHHKVGFVGISNWALDPAKMNRGIFVTRGEPTKQDLQETAKAFFSSNRDKLQDCTELIEGVTKAYLKVCEDQRDVKEFFGLRDYYGLLKMMFTLSMEEDEINFHNLALSILRNFSGSERDVFPIFHDELVKTYKQAFRPRATVVDLVRKNLGSNSQSRFLLLLTKQYSAVSVLKVVIGHQDFQVIFGSSFPRDHDYIEICRNINRIKVCMESGRTVVLLNLRDLYESLYDALNQQYVTFAGQRYVDLGLGGHRVKCRIAEKFKLIVIEEKEVVYNEFPIPLINRLEKHIFEIKSILSEDQLNIVERLSDWVESFADTRQHRFAVPDAFVGYQDDTLASVAINCKQESAEESLQQAKCVLLQTASLDAVVRLPKTNLEDQEEIQQIYSSQFHETLEKLLSAELQFDMERIESIKVFEIMSYSMCLNEQDRTKLEKVLGIQSNRIKLITLQQLQTEEEYTEILNDFFEFATSDNRENQEPVILLIQCPQAQNNRHLIACAKYCAMNKVKEHQNLQINAHVVVAFVFSLERSTMESTNTFTTFHSSECTSIYVDELRPRNNHIAMVGDLWGLTVSEILMTSSKQFLDGTNTTLLDVAHLLQVSIPDAIACLDYQKSDVPRNRVKVLHFLCDDWKLKQHFVSSLVNLIVNLMKMRERSTSESWIVREACSQTALQVGGTFRNTLWLRLRQLVSQAIAQITSIADGDKNLDLIYNITGENAYIVDLWIQFFKSPLCHSKSNDVYSKTYFKVVSQANFTCQFPFSRLITNELSRNWSAIHQSNLDRPDKVFFQKLKSSYLAPLLHAASQHHQMELVERFTHDLINIIYKPSANTLVNQTKELELLRKSMIILFVKERDVKDKFENPLLKVFVIVMKLQKRLQWFREVIGSPIDLLASSEDWVDQQSQRVTFILHSSAFDSAVKHLQSKVADIDKLDRCLEWKDLVVQLKTIGDVICETSNEQLSVSWNHIKFVEIFLEQLIPKTSTHDQEYLKTLGPLARRLWKGANRIKSLGEVKFLNIITNSLNQCINEIQVKMLCSWQDTKCRACSIDRVNVPVRLSCGHFICHNCVTVVEDSSCPACRRSIENVQDIQPVNLSQEQAKDLEAFKTACTSFFLEYLSTFSFPSFRDVLEDKDRVPRTDKILYVLKTLVICDKGTCIPTCLSTLDTNPTARSYILQLLMRCNKLLVKEQLDRHFRSMAAVMGDKCVLMNIYIQCTQDMLSNRAQALQEGDRINIEFTESLLISVHNAVYKASSQVDHLDVTSNLLYISRIIAESIYLIGSQKIRNLKYKRDLQKLVDTSCHFFSDKLVMKQYIIKYLCRRFGIDAFNYTLDNDLYRTHLLPQNLIPDEGRSDETLYLQFDNFVLAGPVYIRTKNLLFDIAQAEDLPRLLQDLIREIQQVADSVFQIMLALTTWTARSSTNLELRNQTYNYVCQHISMHLTGNVNPGLFRDIREGNLAMFRVPDVSAQMQYKITDLLTMAGMTFLSNGNGLITQLNGLINNAEQFMNSFLPTMPCSNYFEVRKVMQLEKSHNTSPKAYLCPNGHVYFIGECTNPNQRGVCPDCGKAIGGRAHGYLETGNTVGELTEQSQAGYLLKPANQRQQVIPERSMTKPSVCATRVCLHAAMLLGSRRGNAIQRLIKVGGGVAQVIKFLMCQLMKDLEQLADCIGKSVDDAILLMQQILHQIRKQNLGNAAEQFNFATMESREKWEEGFQRQFLSLVFRDTDRMLDAAQQVIIGSGELSEKPLNRLVYELNISSQLEDGVVEWSCPALWKYRTHIDLHHLKLRLEAINIEGEGAMLKVLLNTENLSLIQDLTVVLRVQREFISRYQNKIDVSESDEILVYELIDENDGVLKDKTNQYIAIWNKLRVHLGQHNRYNTPLEYFDKEMSTHDKISMCLPSDRGRGCCALVLAEYLIELQNDILNHALELVQPKPEFRQIDVCDIEPKHLICINEKRDLMPLILANSQYEATVSDNRPQHNITYNLPLLQKKVIEKFIVGRKIIKKETIPRMTYPQDVGLGKDCEVLRVNYHQAPLPAELIQSIDTSIKNARKADICEAVRYVTLVIQLLVKLGGEAEQTICEYAESELLLLPDETALIPRSAKISHCFALYERLSWHRALVSERIGQNPFQLVADKSGLSVSEKLPDELETQLGQALHQMKNIEVLQFELNSLMMVGQELKEDLSLNDVLSEYMERRHDDPDTKWCSLIPKGVSVKHARQVFALSMKFMAK